MNNIGDISFLQIKPKCICILTTTYFLPPTENWILSRRTLPTCLQNTVVYLPCLCIINKKKKKKRIKWTVRMFTFLNSRETFQEQRAKRKRFRLNRRLGAHPQKCTCKANIVDSAQKSGNWHTWSF